MILSNKTLEQKIEAILFYKNEPEEIKILAKIVNVTEKAVRDALKNLENSLENRGICLVQTETEVALATAKDLKELIESIARDEMNM